MNTRKYALLALFILLSNALVFGLNYDSKTNYNLSLYSSKQSFSFKNTSGIELLVAGETNDKIPEPYSPDEFPAWSKAIRRFEIVFFGSLPVSFLGTALVYNISLAIVQKTPTENDLINQVLISLSLSGVLAILDLIINQSKLAKARREQESLYGET